MASDWKAEQVWSLASSISVGAKLRYSLEPELNTFTRITESSYWTRLWVVQEKWEVLKVVRSGLCLPTTSEDVDNDGLEAMLGLINTRDARNTDATMLENRVEVFAKHGYGELRDRVYALLGLANDSSPLVNADGDVDSVDYYIGSLNLEIEHPFRV